MKQEHNIFVNMLSSDECASLDELQLFVDGSASDKVRNHVASCSICQTESAMLQSFETGLVPEEDAPDVRWIAKQLRKRSPVRKFQFRGWNLALAGGLCCAVLVLAIGVSRRNPDTDSPVRFNHEAEVLRAGAIADLSPGGDIKERPREFHWKDPSNAPYFEVKLMQVDQSTLWSGTTKRSSILVPDAVRNQILPYKMILWQVVARGNDGKALYSSPLQRFRIVP